MSLGRACDTDQTMRYDGWEYLGIEPSNTYLNEPSPLPSEAIVDGRIEALVVLSSVAVVLLSAVGSR